MSKVLSRVLVVVMDGVGIRQSRFGNAVALARTPNLDSLIASRLSTTLKAHGTYVGLPSDDDIGNSEVGHNALGAGRIFAQGAKLVNIAIDDGVLFKGAAWNNLIQSVRTKKSTLHFLGLLSDGNVHSHERHLFAMLRQAKKDGIAKVRVHALLDGRDVGEKSAELYVGRLNAVMTELRDANFDIQVASGGGRMHITMDRYNADWQMVKRGWDTHVLGRGRQFSSLDDALIEFRKDPTITDQHIPAFVIAKDGQPVGKIVDGDAVVLFNFRGDRAIEISRAFTEQVFTEFEREYFPKVLFAGMMQYDGDLKIPENYLVTPPAISGTLSAVLADLKVRQYACSETQKFGHVTYFWNGNRSGYFDQATEEYLEIPSDPAEFFEQRPEMKAVEIADATIDRMERGTFDFGRINFANGDMVGHTGSLPAAIAAVESVDTQLGRLMAAADRTQTTLLITADHGNADEMFDGKEKDFPNWETVGFARQPTPKTAHTLAPVPFLIYGFRVSMLKFKDIEPRSLGNVANTALVTMGLAPRPEFLPSLVEEI